MVIRCNDAAANCTAANGPCDGRGCSSDAYPQAGTLQPDGYYLCPGCGGGPLPAGSVPGGPRGGDVESMPGKVGRQTACLPGPKSADAAQVVCADCGRAAHDGECEAQARANRALARRAARAAFRAAPELRS